MSDKKQWQMKAAVRLIVEMMLEKKSLALSEIADALSAEFELDKRPVEMAIRVIRNLADDRHGKPERVRKVGEYRHSDYSSGRNRLSIRGIYGFTKEGAAWAIEKYREAPKQIGDEKCQSEPADISSFGFIDYASLLASAWKPRSSYAEVRQ
jgi:hypothetical protein